MSRAGENAHSGDVTVIQEVRGLAEELTNLRQENTILQGNFDEVRKISCAFGLLCILERLSWPLNVTFQDSIHSPYSPPI
ncbi:hypothetical protein N9L76_00230 [bacterium]|nr:hypothetical protein [bacterium]